MPTADLSSNAPDPAAASQTWTLGIATYNRRDVLLECLRLAATQTRPPKQIVVVDASPDRDVTRKAVMDGLAPQYPFIDWVFEDARMPSAAVQRNQCLELATGDAVFLFDDDSLMYPECAEAIMRVYEADAEQKLTGVAAVLAAKPPGPSGAAEKVKDIEAVRAAPSAASYGGLAKMVRGFLKADDLFVPYDPAFPDHPLPPAVKALGCGRRWLMAGMTMTVRREPALKERFSELILDRGPEDSDISYRLSRRGPIATCFEAEVFHVGSPAGRFSKMSRVATGCLGPMVLHRLHGTDQGRSRRASKSLTRRRAIIGLVKDLKTRQWKLPHFRGCWLALRQANRIFSMPREQIEDWYLAYQRKLTGRS